MSSFVKGEDKESLKASLPYIVQLDFGYFEIIKSIDSCIFTPANGLKPTVFTPFSFSIFMRAHAMVVFPTFVSPPTTQYISGSFFIMFFYCQGTLST